VPLSIRPAERIRRLPPYLFAEIDRMKKEVAARGVDLISLGIGDPDRPTFPHIVAALAEAAARPANHRYPDYEGLPSFRAAAAAFVAKRFGVTLDPATEVVSLIGSKEGIANLAVAFVDPDDVVLVPDPGYPVYGIGTLFNGGTIYRMPLTAENGFLPDLAAIPEEIARRAKLMWLGYPNNPTAAVATPAFFASVVEFATCHGILVAHDNAYSEIYYDEPPPSFLATPGAEAIGIEFHSLSKTYNMTGWRIAWVCGNAELIKGLATIKDSVDSGAFQAIQEAAIAALEDPASQPFIEDMKKLYKRRRDLFVDAMTQAGWKMQKPSATFYVWARTPKGFSSTETAGKILDEVGVVCTPGVGFGPSGEGYVRFALSVEEDRMMEAVERMKKIKWVK